MVLKPALRAGWARTNRTTSGNEVFRGMTGDDEPADLFLKTAPFSEDDLDELEALRGRRAQQASVSLLIYHRDGVKVVPISEGQSVVIGRCAPSPASRSPSAVS